MPSNAAGRHSQFVSEGFRPYEHQGSERQVPYNRPWHLSKVAIRGFDIAFCFIVIGISVYVSFWTWDGIIILISSGPPAVVALIWDIAELVTICARGGRRGIHPGAQVGVHLVLWLAFAAAAGVESITIYFRDSFDSYTSYSGSRVAFVNKIIAMQNTVLALTSLLLIGHFVIFVRACMETSQRNKRPPILMVPVSVPGPMAEESYAPYPHPPQQAYMSPQAEKGHMSGAQPPSMGSYTPPGADGTYYGPGQAR